MWVSIVKYPKLLEPGRARALPSNGAVAGAPSLEATALHPLPGCGGSQHANIFHACIKLVPLAQNHCRCAGNRERKRKRDIKTGKQYAHLAGEVRGPILSSQATFVLSNHWTQRAALGGCTPAAGDPCLACKRAPSCPVV